MEAWLPFQLALHSGVLVRGVIIGNQMYLPVLWSEAVNRNFRKVIKTKGAFTGEDSARKLIYVALMQAKHRRGDINGWKMGMNDMAITIEERIAAARS